MVNNLKTEWFQPDKQIIQSFLNLDLLWNVIHLLPQTIFRVEIQNPKEKEDHYNPGWSGFHAKV